MTERMVQITWDSSTRPGWRRLVGRGARVAWLIITPVGTTKEEDPH